jgi:hypothetical protein
MTNNTNQIARTLDDITALLTEASRISNHRSFVIAGSLCALAAVMRPPNEMVISRDVDFYPKLDPGRGFIEIAKMLGEGSKFEKEHGFYADPITPELLLRPEGWEARMVQIPLTGGIVAWFMDVNDAAVGKLARSSENDIRWVISGLGEGMLNAKTIIQRCKATQAMTSEELEKCRQTIDRLIADEGSDEEVDGTDTQK